MPRRLFCFFFFQAEDGIRDLTVTGVQTCALPIAIAAAPSARWRRTRPRRSQKGWRGGGRRERQRHPCACQARVPRQSSAFDRQPGAMPTPRGGGRRSRVSTRRSKARLQLPATTARRGVSRNNGTGKLQSAELRRLCKERRRRYADAVLRAVG